MIRIRGALLALFLGAALAAQAPAGARAARWKADLESFAAHYAREHPSPFQHLSGAEFRRRIRALEQELPSLEDHVVAARWAALVADLGDEHTEVDFDPEFDARALPVEIETFSDGAFIIGAAPPCQDLLGARLERVEGRSMEELRAALKPYVPFHQEGWFRHVFDESFGVWPLLLDAAGIVKVKERWSLSGTTAAGEAFLREVPLEPETSLQDWVWEEGAGLAALREQHWDSPYFFEKLEEAKALYFRLRRCDESPRRPFRAVLSRALRTFRKDRLQRLVVDLRGNTGGSEALVARLVGALQSEPRARGQGRLVVLTDGAVFSAAAVAAWRLRQEAGALLVGEPCGAGPNHCGMVEDLRLPSGRRASFGTEIHTPDRAHPRDFASPILPDLAVGMSHADKAAGRDPVLQAALDLP